MLSTEASELTASIQEVTRRPAVMMCGLTPALLLLIRWILSVERRLNERDIHD